MTDISRIRLDLFAQAILAAVPSPPLSPDIPCLRAEANPNQAGPLITWHTHPAGFAVRLDWLQAPTAQQVADADAAVTGYALPSDAQARRMAAKALLADSSPAMIAFRAKAIVDYQNIPAIRQQFSTFAAYMQAIGAIMIAGTAD